jgi:hypothetical protein
MAIVAVAAPAVSDAEPRATCQAACQRFTDCKMPSYTKMCRDECKRNRYESSENGRAQLLTMTRTSCQQLQGAAAGQQRSSTPTGSARNASTRTSPASTQGGDDMAELDKLEKELNELDQQLGNDEAELERRSRGVKTPARGAAGPARGAGAPSRRAGSSGKGRGDRARTEF